MTPDLAIVPCERRKAFVDFYALLNGILNRRLARVQPKEGPRDRELRRRLFPARRLDGAERWRLFGGPDRPPGTRIFAQSKRRPRGNWHRRPEMKASADSLWRRLEGHQNADEVW
jgi:hypothetical protein